MAKRLVITAITALFLQSCAREDSLRTEGLTLGAGDAIARNSTLQVIDPWPAGVEDTDLVVPNTRDNPKVDDAANGAPIKPQSTAANP